MIFLLTYRTGSGWDSCQCVPPIAKMGPWTDGAILTHKPSLQTSQELDFHVIQSPPAPQQRMLCCQGARIRMIKRGLLGHIQCQKHLMPLTNPRIIDVQRDNSENGRKHHFPNERETKRLPNQAPLLQGPLQEQRAVSQPCPDLQHFPPMFLRTLTWTVVSTHCWASHGYTCWGLESRHLHPVRENLSDLAARETRDMREKYRMRRLSEVTACRDSALPSFISPPSVPQLLPKM